MFGTYHYQQGGLASRRKLVKTLAWESAGLVQEIRTPCALHVGWPASLELEASCFWRGGLDSVSLASWVKYVL